MTHKDILKETALKEYEGKLRLIDFIPDGVTAELQAGYIAIHWIDYKTMKRYLRKFSDHAGYAYKLVD